MPSDPAPTPHPAGTPHDAEASELFHPTGLIYFWVINDGTDRPRLVKIAEQLKARGIAAVVLHPRSGLRIPYGSNDWFELIHWLVELCQGCGIQVWLYDEDPFPSGNAGGRVVAQHPEFCAREIVGYTYDTKDATQDAPPLFRFPLEQLLWCGLIDPATGRVHADLTNRVGVLREAWTVLEQWDSRYYYPQTPRYDCPRAWTHRPTYALQVPPDLAGLQLVAYVAQPVKTDHWDNLADPLNPDATQAFLELTHTRYATVFGHLFDQTVPAIFTDEAKPAGQVPYTPGMLESFERTFGYALTPRLAHLFTRNHDPDQMRTRLDFRRWVATRFEDAWLAPVEAWCRDHGLKLVGHLSPEDDPIEQAYTLGNLMPMQQRLSLPGVDLIIPAVGDDDHPILNIGIIAARSVCDQQQRPGVLSESLACSGIQPDHRIARRVLSWQTVMGMTSPVVHAAYESMEGHRAIDAPPDWGPMAEDWPNLCQLGVDLQPLQDVLRRSRQAAPVAVVWPIRSYHAMGTHNAQEDVALRKDLLDLMTLLLDAQIGFHFVDEQDLTLTQVSDGRVQVGAAQFRHLVVPPSLILHQATLDQLRAAAASGVDVRGIGQAPEYADADRQVTPCRPDWPQSPISPDAITGLPRILDIASPVRNIRSTAWSHTDGLTTFLTSLNRHTVDVTLPNQHLRVEPSDVWMKTHDGPWRRCFEGLQEQA